MNSQIIIDFGQYKNNRFTAEQLFTVDPRYCYWITTKKSFRKNRAKLVNYFNQKLSESASIFNNKTMGFGKYYGLNVGAFINDKSYCKWLLSNNSFLDEYPDMHEELKELYDIIYPNNICYFYVLLFHGADFIKIGHTKQSIVRRAYNYLYDYTDYTKYNLDIQNSFVYQTNYLQIEKFMLTQLSDFRLNKKEEKFELNALSLLNDQMQILEKKGEFNFHKKPLTDLIPFEDGETWKQNFYIKLNNFQNFEDEYLEMLKCSNLYHKYQPFHFVDIQHWSLINRFN